MSEFEDLLGKAESLCDKFPKLVHGYSVNNAFGTLHFLMARNVRFIRTSYELMLSYKYAESFAILRSTMEGALMMRHFAENPLEMQAWYDLDLKIKVESDKDKRNILLNERRAEFEPGAIRRKVAKGNAALAKDFSDVYSNLCDITHTPVPQEGDFIIAKEGGHEITRIASFDERQVKNWLNAAILFLTSTLKIFDTLYMKKFFAHLGVPFALELKQVAETTLRLLAERAAL